MTTTYTPCEGTGQDATDTRVMHTAGSGSKFFRLNGKVAARCPACGKSVRVPSMSNPRTPAHKAALALEV